MASSHNLINIKGRWYYNRRVPKPLITHFGTALIRHSLGTQDLAAAKKLRTIKDVEWDALFDDALRPTPASQKGSLPISVGLVAQIVRSYVDRETTILDQKMASSSLPDEETRSDIIIEADQTIKILNNPESEELGVWISRTIGRLLDEGDLASTKSGQDLTQFAPLVIRGLIEIEKRRMAKYSNDHTDTHFDHLFGPQHQTDVPFRAIANQFLAQRIEEAIANRRSQKTIDKITSTVATISEIIGAETGLRQIDYDACQRVRTTIAKMPVNRSKVFGALPIEKAIARCTKEGRKTLAAHTQGMYISTFKAILELAAEKKLIGHNPAGKLRALTQETKSAQEKRAPWSSGQLTAFFTSDFYVACSPTSAAPYLNNDREWRFWLPLICLFMGMRPNEVCQLLVSDVRQTAGGVWFLDITDVGGDGNKTVKTAASRRKMALHPELIKIGFLQYHQSRLGGKGGNRLFIGWKPDKYGNHATYPLKRFNESFIPNAVELADNQSFYSLRHTFRDALRRIDASATVLKALGAWEHGTSVSDHYGDQYDLGLQVDAISKVAYPDLDLTFLHI